MFVVRYQKLWLALTALIFAASVGVIAVLGLPLGIDFTGGALTEVSYDERPEKEMLEGGLSGLGLGSFSLRRTTDEAGRPGYILRSRDLSEEERQAVDETLTSYGEGGEVVRFTSIGPVIGQELRDKAVWAIGGVVLIILFYVAFAFRGVTDPVSSWIYGAITIFVLLHDVLVPTALMSVLGAATGAEADVLFVMALLAILGYSVNDTIVVFDRVRENLIRWRQEKKEKQGEEEVVTYVYTKPFPEIVGISVGQTLARSINTSLTTLLALTALFLIGADATKTFALVLIAGIAAGAYSSLFIASPLLIAIAKRQEAKQQDKNEV